MKFCFLGVMGAVAWGLVSIEVRAENRENSEIHCKAVKGVLPGNAGLNRGVEVFYASEASSGDAQEQRYLKRVWFGPDAQLRDRAGQLCQDLTLQYSCSRGEDSIRYTRSSVKSTSRTAILQGGNGETQIFTDEFWFGSAMENCEKRKIEILVEKMRALLPRGEDSTSIFQTP